MIKNTRTQTRLPDNQQIMLKVYNPTSAIIVSLLSPKTGSIQCAQYTVADSASICPLFFTLIFNIWSAVSPLSALQ